MDLLTDPLIFSFAKVGKNRFYLFITLKFELGRKISIIRTPFFNNYVNYGYLNDQPLAETPTFHTKVIKTVRAAYLIK